MNARRLAAGLRYHYEEQGAIATISTVVSYASRYLYYRVKYGLDAPSPFEVIDVSPTDIRYLISPSELRDYLGTIPGYRVLGGDWDLLKSEFESYFVHNSFVAHFEDGVSWEQTSYYDHLQNHPTREITELYEYDDLYEEIQHNGYDRSYPIEVHVGRGGELIRHDGAHRLSIAKVLDLESIPAKVLIRHSRFQTDPTVSVPTFENPSP